MIHLSTLYFITYTRILTINIILLLINNVYSTYIKYVGSDFWRRYGAYIKTVLN